MRQKTQVLVAVMWAMEDRWGLISFQPSGRGMTLTAEGCSERMGSICAQALEMLRQRSERS